MNGLGSVFWKTKINKTKRWKMAKRKKKAEKYLRQGRSGDVQNVGEKTDKRIVYDREEIMEGGKGKEWIKEDDVTSEQVAGDEGKGDVDEDLEVTEEDNDQESDRKVTRRPKNDQRSVGGLRGVAHKVNVMHPTWKILVVVTVALVAILGAAWISRLSSESRMVTNEQETGEANQGQDENEGGGGVAEKENKGNEDEHLANEREEAEKDGGQTEVKDPGIKEPSPDPELDLGPEPEAITTPPSASGNVGAPNNADGRKLVALTFDDGPSAATTGRLLDILNNKGVKVTFFVLGTMAQRAPDVVRRAEAEGHEVASHTMWHNNLSTEGVADLQGEAATMNQVFTEILGRTPKFTRPPYGNFTSEALAAFGQPFVIWSVDPEDWRYRNAATVRSNVVGATRDGDIVLMHDIYASTVDAVEGIIDDLRAQGYEFLTVSELAAARGVGLASGYAYYYFR